MISKLPEKMRIHKEKCMISSQEEGGELPGKGLNFRGFTII
jgi:hypothetical protein